MNKEKSKIYIEEKICNKKEVKRFIFFYFNKKEKKI